MFIPSIYNQTHIKDQAWSYCREAIQIIGGSLLIALCSQIKIVLPFTMIPLTLQTLAVLLLGGLFGSRKGALMVLAYWGEILMGMPVLAGGTVDPLVFLGPRGGYVIGYMIQAFWMGWFVERAMPLKTRTLILAGVSACLMELGLGTCWLSLFVGWKAVLTMGFYPFIPGEILKVLAVTAFIKNNKLS